MTIDDPSQNIDVRRLKWLLLGASLVSIVFLLLAAFEENISGGWREHQQAYKAALIGKADTDTARAAAEQMNVSFKQIFLPDLDRIDRCVTCHVGVEDPAMAGADQPLTMHPDEPKGLLAHHPFEKFGCTVCHDGQPRATEHDEAHGEAGHWPTPLLRGKAVFTSCGRCHYDVDLYGAEDDLYARGTAHQPLSQRELKAVIPGADAIARGKQLTLESGCLGCHTYRGRGGRLGPDITYVGEKTKHDYDFKHVHGEHTVENWLFEHFKDPTNVTPGTLMPNLALSDQQAHDLTQYMLALRRKAMPAAYTPVPPQQGENQPATGEQLFNMFCASCHGPKGQGSTVRAGNTPQAIDAPPQLMVPSLNHPDTLAVASDAYLRQVVAHGRPGTNMIAWLGAGNGGLRDEEVGRLVDYIRSWQATGPDVRQVSAQRGDARVGRVIYDANCAACHGASGEGGIGPSLNAPSFLAVASDQYLARTIIEGRPDTAMSSYGLFDTQQISDLIAYMKTWHPRVSDRATAIALVDEPDNATVSAELGHILYEANCVTCHGTAGQGDLGPSVNNEAFLTVVDNDYLYTAVTAGRPDTGMPAWRHLSNEDVASLIKLIRSWQTQPQRKLADVTVSGDIEIGQLIYGRACASCHGIEAQGAMGTQLRNAVFMDSASDAMLREWIGYGKPGTQMLGFLKGQQGPVELSQSQIDDVIVYLRKLSLEPSVQVGRNPNGRPELGELWYANACASCHGDKGQGASGPSLSNPAFLRAAGDGFLLATLAMGRDGTEMRPVKKGAQSILSMSSDQVNDIVTFIRGWEADPPYDPGREIPHHFVIPWDLQRGERLYQSFCAGCHGINGKSQQTDPGLTAWAPQLNNDGFLSAATDGFLQATIVRGRIGTAMRPFGHGMHGVADLSSQEIDDIVAYIRRWANDPASPMTLPAEIAATESNSPTIGE